MARVAKMARKNFFGTRRVPFCFTSLARSASLYCKERVYIHMSDCVNTVYELPLLPNNTDSKTSLHLSGAVLSVDWMFITGAPA